MKTQSKLWTVIGAVFFLLTMTTNPLLWEAPSHAADASPAKAPASLQKLQLLDAGKHNSGLPSNGEPRADDEFWIISARELGSDSVGLKSEFNLRVYRNGNGWKETELDQFLDTQKMADKVTIFYVHGNRKNADQAVDEGRLVYRGLLQSRPHMQPLRFVIWSWPSERIRGIVRDARVKAYRADVHAVHLGKLLTQLEQHAPQDLQISIVGYSFGARLALGALHLWAGGELGGTRLDQRDEPHHIRARVTLLAAAEHNYWLQPGAYHGDALRRIDHLILVRNSRDPVLKRYWLMNVHSRPRALGYTGIAGLSLISGGEQRIEHYNLNNRSHNLNAYFYWDYYVEPMRRNILWEPIDAAE